MKVTYTIYSDLMEWKVNKEKYPDKLHNAYFNNDECELDISVIPDEMYLPIIENHIKDIDESRYEEELSAIEGGLVIISGENRIEWQCCSFINDSKEWKKVINNKSNAWERIDIGHPWIYYKINDTDIQFSEYNEIFNDDKDSLSKLKIKMELNYEELFLELQTRLDEVEQFKEKLIDIIKNSDLLKKDIIIKKILRKN